MMEIITLKIIIIISLSIGGKIKFSSNMIIILKSTQVKLDNSLLLVIIIY